MEEPELIAAVDDFLFEAKDDGAEVLVVGEIIPVLGAVEVALVRLLLDGRQLESAAALELLLNGRLPAAELADFRKSCRTHLFFDFDEKIPKNIINQN